MPNRDLVDFSFSPPTSGCLATAGVQGVIMYTSIGPAGKNITKAKADSYLQAGLDVVIVFEESAGHILGGAAAGRVAAGASLNMARAAGSPSGIVHYFALDIDPNVLSTGQWASIAAYLDAAKAVLTPQGDKAGIYGGFLAIEKMVGTHADYGWQTFAWSAGRLSSKAHLYQWRNDQSLCGGVVDYDEIRKRPYGGWKEEKDVPLTSADADLVAAKVVARLGLRDGVRVADSKDVGNLFRGDDGAHPDNLDSLHFDTQTALDKLDKLGATLATLPVGGGVDATAVAQAIVSVLGPELAKGVANELGSRLRGGV